MNTNLHNTKERDRMVKSVISEDANELKRIERIKVSMERYQSQDSHQLYIDGQIDALEKVLSQVLLKEDLQKIEDLLIKVDKQLSLRKAYQFAKLHRSDFANQDDCEIAFLKSVQSSSKAEALVNEMQDIFQNLYNRLKLFPFYYRILDDYSNVLREKYSFNQQNVHLFIEYGFKGI